MKETVLFKFEQAFKNLFQCLPFLLFTDLKLQGVKKFSFKDKYSDNGWEAMKVEVEQT